MKKVVLIGATPYYEVSQIINDINSINQTFDVIGILDDNESMHGRIICGTKVLGSVNMASSFPDDVYFVILIASFKNRIIKKHLLDKLNLPNERFCNLIHPTAIIFNSSKIGNGVILFPGAVIANDCYIGNHSVVLLNSVIGSRNIIGEGVSITSLVVTGPDVNIGNYAYIGIGSSIAPNIEIGPGAMIGMGSSILNNLPAGVFAMGNPGKFYNDIIIEQDIINRWEKLKSSLRIDSIE